MTLDEKWGGRAEKRKREHHKSKKIHPTLPLLLQFPSYLELLISLMSRMPYIRFHSPFRIHEFVSYLFRVFCGPINKQCHGVSAAEPWGSAWIIGWKSWICSDPCPLEEERNSHYSLELRQNLRHLVVKLRLHSLNSKYLFNWIFLQIEWLVFKKDDLF